MPRARSDRLTPSETKALVEKHGSFRAAAKVHGAHYSTLLRWADPEYEEQRRRKVRVTARERYATDPEFRKAVLRRTGEWNRKKRRSMSGWEYNRVLLVNRRYSALKRMEKRNQRRQEERNGALPT